MDEKNANTALNTDPKLKDSEPDLNEVKEYPSSSEANPKPEEIQEQKDWTRKNLS